MVEGRQVAMTITGLHADDALLGRIRSEFLEMPGMCLTVRQAARLWNLDIHTSHAALRLLAEANFLTQTGDGRYVAAGTARDAGEHGQVAG